MGIAFKGSLIPIGSFKVKTNIPPDQHWSNVSLLMHMNGANNSGIFVDEIGHAITRASPNVQIITADSKFGDASAVFDGSSLGYLSTPYSTDLNFGANNYTIEAWVKTTSSKGEIVSSFVPSGTYGGWSFGIGSASNDGTLNHYQGDGVTVGGWTSGTTPVNDGLWHHVAVTRVGTTIKYFVDGVLDAVKTNTNNGANNTNCPIRIGASSNDTLSILRPFTGNIDELRITKGVARYTGTFTVPTSEFPTHTVV